MLRHEHGSGETVGGGVLPEFALKRRKSVAHARQRYLGRTRNRSKLKLENAVGVGGLDFDLDPGELIGVALLHEARESRGHRLFHLDELEATRPIPEVHVPVDARLARRKILIEEFQERRAVAVVKGLEPR